MATVTASHLVSRSSSITCHGVSGLETKANLAQIGLRNQTMTHSGLRSLNNLDTLKMRSSGSFVVRKAMKKDKNTTNDRQVGQIICGQGMSGIFIEAEYKDAWDSSVSVDIIGDSIETVRFFHCYKQELIVWGKTGCKIYGPVTDIDYKNSNKYFSRPYAFVHSFLVASEDVVFIANEWHTTLLPCYLKSNYQPKGLYKKAKVAFCIHNITYQGRFAFSDFSLLNLSNRFRSSFDFMDGYDKLVKGRKINWMKGGILESDRVVTEKTGVELDNIIRKTGISDIVNGMDIQEWNIATDKYLDVLEAKPLLKETLQAEVGLPVDKSIPLLCFISRLEEQKGPDILAAAISKFIDEDSRSLSLGIAKFNIPLAHMIIASSNFMVVPSRFEPCVSIVASTGGLVDTIKEGFTGFHMETFNPKCKTIDLADVKSVAETIKRALVTYRTPALKEMIQNCMAQDLSWKERSKLWEKLLLSLDVARTEGIDRKEIAPMAKEDIATP
ncbi:hypothetical protein UlMin_027981 [Ulmus minor]